MRRSTTTPSSPLPPLPPRHSTTTTTTTGTTTGLGSPNVSFNDVATVQPTSPLLPYDSSFQNENDKANLLVKRIAVWEKIVDAVLPWAKQMQKAEANAAKSYSKLAPLIQFQDDGSATGDLAKSLESLRVFSTSVSSFHEQFSNFLKEQTLPKLEGLQAEVKRQSKRLCKRIEKAGAKLKKGEEEAVGAMVAHQRTCEEMTATPSITVVDPWYTEFRVKGKLNVLVEHHNDFKVHMLEVTEQVVGMDEQVARTVQEAILQLAKWRSKMLTILKGDVDELAVAVSRIMPEADFQQYSQRTGLSRHIEHWKQPMGASSVDYPFRSSELASVIRSGTLLRQGKVMKSRWHTAQCILTHSAFLHLFDNYETAQKEIENPLYSIDLRHCRIQLTSDEDTANNCFEIISGKDRWLIKAQNEEVMVDWMIALRKVKDDMNKRTNPPFSPQDVQQYSPQLPSDRSPPPLPPHSAPSSERATLSDEGEDEETDHALQASSNTGEEEEDLDGLVDLKFSSDSVSSPPNLKPW